MLSPIHILRQYWGFEDFRPLQEDIIQSVLNGRDTLALMPTGGGKSLCFQVPSLCQEGICVVISPLIALMKDQVYQLRRRNIPAEAIYSGMHYREIDRIFDNAVYGNSKFLYLSPERLVTEMARERIAKMKVNLLAVDEAHCISQWGYDFRPPYLQVAEIRSLLPDVPVLALTATATTAVEADIQEKLQFENGQVFKKSYERKNLAYVVLHEEGKMEKLLDILKKVPGSAIVYVRNRRLTKEIARYLLKNRISADFYHAGLNTADRSAKQDLWMQNQNRVMVATNAFGMGIDKADVRVVVHFDLPDSLEAYFQEAGRAGRDGKKAFATLLYNTTDKFRLEKNYDRAFPTLEEIRQVYRALGSFFQLAVGSGFGESFDFDMAVFCRNFQLEAVRTFSCLRILEQAGFIVMSESVYLPASLRILVSKEMLYDYQLRHRQLDPIIKTILRSTQGAFNHYVNINESQLARFLKIEYNVFIKALEKLHQDRMLDYRPQKDTPQIIFIQERIEADNLVIDQELYQFRKMRHQERLRASIQYAEQTRCRSLQLLGYFGEKNVEACGKCDVCLGRNKSDLSPEEFDRYRLKIQRILKKEQLNINDLTDAFSPKRREKVLRAIEFLLDEGILDYKGEYLVWEGKKRL